MAKYQIEKNIRVTIDRKGFANLSSLLIFVQKSKSRVTSRRVESRRPKRKILKIYPLSDMKERNGFPVKPGMTDGV